MSKLNSRSILAIAAMALVFAGHGYAVDPAKVDATSAAAPATAPAEPAPDIAETSAITLGAYTPIIDAHAHYAGLHPVVLKWLAKNNVKLTNIGGGRRSRDIFSGLIKEHPNLYGWITDMPRPRYKDEGFKEADYAAKAIAQIKQDVADGAVSVKIRKSVGMRIKKPDGTYLQIDDPLYRPVFTWMETAGVTLTVHVADPKAAWEPLTETSLYGDRYKKDPRTHYYTYYAGKNFPTYEEILAAHDRVVARHPKLRIVSAHMGNMEHDLVALAARFDKYPNLAIDTCGVRRISALGGQDRQKVQAFFIKYQDRILYGSDRNAGRSAGGDQRKMNAEDLGWSFHDLADGTKIGWDYYATETVRKVKGVVCHGLALPPDVVKKLFYTNAKKWYPGL